MRSRERCRWPGKERPCRGSCGQQDVLWDVPTPVALGERQQGQLEMPHKPEVMLPVRGEGWLLAVPGRAARGARTPQPSLCLWPPARRTRPGAPLGASADVLPLRPSSLPLLCCSPTHLQQPPPGSGGSFPGGHAGWLVLVTRLYPK